MPEENERLRQARLDLIRRRVPDPHAFHRMSRAFAVVYSEPQEENRVAPDMVLPEAYIRWGQAPDFDIEEFQAALDQFGFEVEDTDDDEPERERIQIAEEGRSWVDYRIENPDDPEVYIIARLATRVAMTIPRIDVWAGPVGRRVKYTVSGAQAVWNTRASAGLPMGSTSEEGSGQEPPAPPALDEIV